jgi:hypothetical protein
MSGAWYNQVNKNASAVLATPRSVADYVTGLKGNASDMAEPTTSPSVYLNFIAQVWSLQLRPTEKLILLAWADFRVRNEHPSQESLSLVTGLSSRQVRSVLKRMVADGYLIIESRNPNEVIKYIASRSRMSAAKPADIPNNLGASARKRIRKQLIKESGGRCFHCGHFGTDEADPTGEQWHIDRLLPRAAGGRYEEGNMVLSCSRCNRRKGMNETP